MCTVKLICENELIKFHQIQPYQESNLFSVVPKGHNFDVSFPEDQEVRDTASEASQFSNIDYRYYKNVRIQTISE